MRRASIQSLRPEFTAAQLAALSKPFAAGATAFDDGRDEFLPPGCTAIVTCDVDPPVREPMNPVEIAEVKLFDDDDVPTLAFGMNDMLRDARRGDPNGTLE